MIFQVNFVELENSELGLGMKGGILLEQGYDQEPISIVAEDEPQLSLIDPSTGSSWECRYGLDIKCSYSFHSGDC